MGTTFEVVMAGRAPDYLANAAAEALDEVEALSRQMNLYSPASELSWINRRAARVPVTVEPGLFGLLELAQRVWRETGGAFDITSAALSRAWGFVGGIPHIPDPAELEQARGVSGMSHVKLDRRRRTVSFDRDGVTLDLGGIAKGYAVDRALAILAQKRIPTAAVNGGQSTIKTRASPEGEAGWPVAIRYPPVSGPAVDTVTLRDQSLSTAAAYGKRFEVAGVVYGHIMDPRSGRPARGMLSASALTVSAAESDALATAFFVLGIDGAREYCRKHEGIEALLIPEPAPGQAVGMVRVGGEDL
jgi:thiamine biosynthesis lipoprotein